MKIEKQIFKAYWQWRFRAIIRGLNRQTHVIASYLDASKSQNSSSVDEEDYQRAKQRATLLRKKLSYVAKKIKEYS
jgi:hypothetical protein